MLQKTREHSVQRCGFKHLTLAVQRPYVTIYAWAKTTLAFSASTETIISLLFVHNTRLYCFLRNDAGENEYALTTDDLDPNTGFRLLAVIKEKHQIKLGAYARIQHAATGQSSEN